MSAEPVEPIEYRPSNMPDPQTDTDALLIELIGIARSTEEKLDSLITAHNDTVTKVNGLIDNVAPHLEEIAPMIDAIAENPAIRMLTGGGRKKRKELP